jgi:hypothetical protein
MWSPRHDVPSLPVVQGTYQADTWCQNQLWMKDTYLRFQASYFYQKTRQRYEEDPKSVSTVLKRKGEEEEEERKAGDFCLSRVFHSFVGYQQLTKYHLIQALRAYQKVIMGNNRYSVVMEKWMGFRQLTSTFNDLLSVWIASYEGNYKETIRTFSNAVIQYALSKTSGVNVDTLCYARQTQGIVDSQPMADIYWTKICESLVNDSGHRYSDDDLTRLYDDLCRHKKVLVLGSTGNVLCVSNMIVVCQQILFVLSTLAFSMGYTDFLFSIPSTSSSLVKGSEQYRNKNEDERRSSKTNKEKKSDLSQPPPQSKVFMVDSIVSFLYKGI